MANNNNIKKVYHQWQWNLAKAWLNINLQLTVVGVTGSYGKTATVNAIAKVLSAKYSVNKTDPELDTLYNLPVTILKTKIWNEILVLEYGIDHLGEMDKHLSLVKPKIAILTGITPVHTDEAHFGSLKNLIIEKTKLIEALPQNGLAIFNWDDENAREIAKGFLGKKISYGIDEKADIWADKIKVNLEETKFELKDGQESVEVETGLLGYPAVYSCLTAWIVGKQQKVSKERMIKKMAELKPLRGRFNVEPGPLGTILVNDSKRANFASTIAGLRSFAQFPGRKIAVMGEMGEIGEMEEELHCKVGKKVAELKIDFLVGVGPLAKFTVNEAKKSGLKNAFWTKDVNEAADLLKHKLNKGDLLYLKASLLRHLERIIMLLEGRKVSCEKVVCHHYPPCGACNRLIQ